MVLVTTLILVAVLTGLGGIGALPLLVGFAPNRPPIDPDATAFAAVGVLDVIGRLTVPILASAGCWLATAHPAGRQLPGVFGRASGRLWHWFRVAPGEAVIVRLSMVIVLALFSFFNELSPPVVAMVVGAFALMHGAMYLSVWSAYQDALKRAEVIDLTEWKEDAGA